MTAPPSEVKTFHFPHLDAIRGLAAVCVLIFHIGFSSALSPVWLRVVSPSVNTMGHMLANGVEVFFVLSGWVIAHSMRRDSLQFSSLGRFLVRRTLRLTPPYWAAIVLMLVLGVAGMRLGSGDTFPSASKIAFNFLYLQNILGVGNVFSPAWTLCIEAQFYIAFATLLWLAASLGRGHNQEEPFVDARTPLALLLFVSTLGTLGIVCFWNDAALFVSWWFYFAGGALGYLASRDSRYLSLVGVGIVVMFAVSLWLFLHPSHSGHEGKALLIGTLALLFLMLAHGRARWTEWGRIGLFAWLGSISYSLYLTHFGFGLLVARVFRKMVGQNAPMALGLIVVDMALCLVVAHFFWLWIERPSIRWAQSLKLKGNAHRERAGVAT